MNERVFIISLGCAKNQVDSEKLAGAIASKGFEFAEDLESADIIFVNTCAFIEPAVKESVDVILHLEELKGLEKVKKIGVLGCLLNRYGDDLKREFPTVDIWARSEEWEHVLSCLGVNDTNFSPCSRGFISETTSWSRYLKITEGCNNCCSYCTIPTIRGQLRSRPIDEILEEAENLELQGAKEICLVGQDLTAYGMDWDGSPHLVELLDLLEKHVSDDMWIRLLYLHPMRVNEVFLERITSYKKVLRYLDIPIQHVDDEILSSMNRHVTESDLRRIFSYARRIDPDFALRTTIIVGFPGEDNFKFKKVLRFLEDMEIDRVGAFLYSPEEGTKAVGIKNQVSDEVKRKRLDILMELQADISLVRQERFLGRTLKVIVEEKSYEDCALGRSFREAPEVDGVIAIKGVKDVPCGDFVNVRINAVTEHDMEAEVVVDEG